MALFLDSTQAADLRANTAIAQAKDDWYNTTAPDRAIDQARTDYYGARAADDALAQTRSDYYTQRSQLFGDTLGPPQPQAAVATDAAPSGQDSTATGAPDQSQGDTDAAIAAVRQSYYQQRKAVFGDSLGKPTDISAGGTAVSATLSDATAPDARTSGAPSPSPALTTPAPTTWAPAATSRQTAGWTPPTTAAMSGGVPRTVSQTGGAFFGLDNQALQTVSAAGDLARQAGYGDEGARALQSVLVTEGGLTGARGDRGASSGPLQFFRDKGELPAFANHLGMNQDDAANYAEQNPVEAIRWAVGTADQPGYLGHALAQGLQKGLTGATLATFAQQYGQRSQSPQRAGQWHDILFGNGQDPFSSSALTQRQTVGLNANQPGGLQFGPGAGTLAPTSSDALTNPLGTGNANTPSGAAIINRASQFIGQPYVWGGKDPSTGFDCSGLAGYVTTGQAESTGSLYGKSASIHPEDAQPGDLVFYNMGSPDPHLQHVAVYLGDGKVLQAGGTQRNVNIGTVGQAIGSPPEFRRLGPGGAPAQAMPAGGPTLSKDQELYPSAASAASDDTLTPASPVTAPLAAPASMQPPSAASGNQPLWQTIGNRVQSPQTGNPVVDTAGTTASALGTTANVVSGALRYISPESSSSRTIAGSDQWAKEYAAAGGPDLERQLQDLQSRRLGGEQGLEPQIQQIGQQLTTINQRISGGQAYGEAVLDVAERNPSLPALETGANLAGGVIATGFSAEAMPIAAKVAAELLQPGSNAGNVIKALGSEQQAVNTAADQLQKMPGTAQLAPVRATTPQSGTDLLQAMLDAAKANGKSDPQTVADLQRQIDALDPVAAQRRALSGANDVRAAVSQPSATVADAADRTALNASPETNAIATAPEPLTVAPPPAASTTTQANPFMLATEPGPGRTALSTDDVLQHLQDLDAQHTANDQRIMELQNRLEGGTLRSAGVVHPPGTIGWTDAEVIAYARDNGLNPYSEDGWPHQAGDAAKIASQRPRIATTAKQTPAAVRAEVAQLQAVNQQLEQATEHIWSVADDGTPMYRVEQTSEDLPWEAPYNATSDAAAPTRPAATAGADLAGANAAYRGANESALESGSGAPAPTRAANGRAGAPAAAALTEAPPPIARNGAPAPGPALSTAATTGPRSWDTFFTSSQFDQLSLADKRQYVLEAARGGTPPDVGTLTTATARPGAPPPLGAEDAFAPTELAAGLTPQRVMRSAQDTFAPATRASTDVQTALNTMDSANRGLQSMVDNLVHDGTITQDTADSIYSSGRRSAYQQLLVDVRKAADPSGTTGVMAITSGATRPAGWVSGGDYNVDRVWLSPENAKVIDNIRKQMLGTTGGLTSAAMKTQGLFKESALGGSIFHLSAETINAAFLNREQAPRVIGQALLNALDPTGKAFDAMRFSSGGRTLFQRAAEAGVTQLTRTPEGELVDLFRGPKGTAIRMALGGAGGAVHGYLTAPNDQDRFSNAIQEGLKGAAFGAVASYMIPALWTRGVPTLKALSFNTLVNRGLSDKAAATVVNNVFGGENLVRIARDPTVQQVLRIGMFAPDWWTSNARTLGRAANVTDMSEVGKESKAFIATAAVTGAMFVARLNYALADHSPLENEPDHIADIDMTKVWGPDPKTGRRQFLRLPGPWPEIVNAVVDPQSFLLNRAGIAPNLASEAFTGQPLSQAVKTAQAGKPTGYYIPNVMETASRTEPISERPDATRDQYGRVRLTTGVAPKNLVQRALDVLAEQLQGMEPAAVTSAERMATRGGAPAAALSLATGVSERAGQAPPPPRSAPTPIAPVRSATPTPASTAGQPLTRIQLLRSGAPTPILRRGAPTPVVTR